MPKIRFKLGVEDIERAIHEVELYRDRIDQNCQKITRIVCDEIEYAVSVGFNGAPTGDIHRKEGQRVVYEGQEVPDVTVGKTDGDKKSSVYAEGKSAVLQEFGAGVYYNGSAGSFPHPDTPAGISAIGTYGKGYGARKIWGYYDDSGELVLTHGTPASMPMYHAAKEVEKEIPEIARKVFKDGGNG